MRSATEVLLFLESYELLIPRKKEEKWMKQIKLMFLCHGIGNGGAERVITTLASEFSKRNYRVAMITTNEEKNDYILAESVEKNKIESSGGNAVVRTIERIYKLAKYIREYQPDCVISFSSIPNIQILLATVGARCKVIISERTDPSRYPTSKARKMLRQLLYPRADKIVFQTIEAREYFNEKIKKKGIVIPNPIREDLPEPFCGIREKKIVGIGSLGEQKNWPAALKACEMFFEKYPDYTFDIFGEGPDKENLQEYIDNNSLLRNRVRLRGFSANVVQEMNDARMYISSSDYEGISNAMLEALATGVPTICTDCPVGGAREFITSEENGILVPVGDVDALSKAMVRVTEDDDLCQRFSNGAVKIRNRLNLNEIVDIWEKEVKHLCLKK